MRILLDTNVISELVSRQPDPHVMNWIRGVDAEACLSAVTVGELTKGVAKLPDSRRKRELAQWLTQDLLERFQGRILSIDASVAITWGGLVARLELAGTPLPALDGLVAAQAIHYGCTLATRNVRHFASTGAALVNPWESAGPGLLS